MADLDWLKKLLDEELFGKLLSGWEHKMSLVTFATGDDKKMVVAFLDTKTFPEDVVGLLKKGARLDYFRYPTPLDDAQKIVVFGRDGLPTFASTPGGGYATARFFVDSTPKLVFEVRKTTQSATKAIEETSKFYDLAAQELSVEANDMSKKFGAT